MSDYNEVARMLKKHINKKVGELGEGCRDNIVEHFALMMSSEYDITISHAITLLNKK